MTDQGLPPVRTTHMWRAPGGRWCYDSWGRHGRPVVLIPAVMFDRVMWWPAAADLRPHATVIAVDPPGHGGSARRDHYDPDELVNDLAELVRSVGVTRAPIVVGHASSAALAQLFAARYAAHAVVTVDALHYAPLGELDEYLDTMCVGDLPSRYRDMVTPVRSPELLKRYADCIQLPRRTATAARTPHLAVYSQEPPGTVEPGRREIYGVAGRFAHLGDVRRFVHDIRALL